MQTATTQILQSFDAYQWESDAGTRGPVCVLDGWEIGRVAHKRWKVKTSYKSAVHGKVVILVS